MSGYIRLNRTGFGPFDDSLSLIEEAGDSYHHTSQWIDEGWNGEKPYIDRINESIEFAANSYSDLIDALTALKAELREICAAIDDPACDLTLTAVECIKKLKGENASLQKDAARLDWVEHQDFYDLSFAVLVDQPNDGMIAVSIGEGWHLGNNLREAIDAAMAQGDKP